MTINGCNDRVESSVVDLPRDIKLFDVFDDYDRFAFPEAVYRVTGGHGGEAILICGSEKTALLDCGMAYCAQITVQNVLNRLAALGRQRLDYILLSHSHYDHIGALPWMRESFPGAVVCGSEHCAHILKRPGAHALMKELGEDALQLYEPGSTKEIRVDGLGVDRVLRDGDVISLGEQRVTAFETPGHTDCSMSFFLQPQGLLFTSESTGIIEGKVGGTPDGRGYIHTPVLKDFHQALQSMEKCRALHPAAVCLPHFGMVPPGMLDRYWDDFAEECESKIAFARLLKDGGLSDEEMLDRYAARYWTTYKAMEQPKEAFLINSKHILRALMKEIDRRDNSGI
ncbi:MAG: MBL fold metallo-hydrolase [Firmicutes bacterium]|nr:MBL fold metallo-hydrolase [Bacillota bacterium]